MRGVFAMETLVMHARIVTIAAAALLASTSGMAAEPVKKPAPQPKQAVSHPTPTVVLASNDPTARERGDTAPPIKHHAGRITTCRCGGEPQPAQPEEQQ